ncbi:MAG: LAGLIDADG family homing endonuclease [Candidatus Wolfebacteria bacterium]|nr:LAGLIDADG family homing endonuclease [Candidatus Wolfebacteria bacterium]
MYPADTSNTMFTDKQSEQKEPLSWEYIRGLVDGEGCFTFCPGRRRGNGKKYKIPTFVIGMNERDASLLEMVKKSLRLRNKIYYRKGSGKDGYKRGCVAVLMVREFDQLKDIIIPLFYKKLKGYKGVQFTGWLEKIGSDPDVSDRFKSLYRLYKWGMYDKLSKFTEKFPE